MADKYLLPSTSAVNDVGGNPAIVDSAPTASHSSFVTWSTPTGVKEELLLDPTQFPANATDITQVEVRLHVENSGVYMTGQIGLRRTSDNSIRYRSSGTLAAGLNVWQIGATNPWTSAAWTAADIRGLKSVVFNATSIPMTNDINALNVRVAATYPPSNVAPTCTLVVNSVDHRTVTVTPTASDTDGTIASLKIVWADGAETTGCVSGQQYSHTYAPSGGTYGIYAVAVDNGGLTTNSSITNQAVAANSAPSCSITVGTRTGRIQRVTPVFSDSDGTIASKSLNWGDGTTAVTDIVSGTEYSHTYSSAGGTFTVTLTATDNEGVVTTVTQSVTIPANQAPSCVVTVDSVVHRTVTVTPTASDADGTLTSLKLEWGDGAESTGCVTGQPYSHTYDPDGGTFGVTAIAVDNEGASTTSLPVSAVIDPNVLPVCSFTAELDGTGRTVTVNANASSDPDGSITGWRFIPGNGAGWIAGVVGEPGTYTYPVLGEYTLRVEVTDNEGATTEQSLVMDINPPMRVELSQDGAVVTATAVPFSETVPTDVVQVQWASGTPWRTTTNLTAVWTYASAGTFQVRVRVRVNGTFYNSDAVAVTIAAGAIPVSPGDGSGAEGEDIMDHGIYNRTEPTSVISPITAPSAVPFVVGTAPVHVAGGTPSVNVVEKFTTWAEVVAKFGYVHDFGRYSLMEFLYHQLRIAGISPVYAVNVFDPAAIAGAASSTSKAMVAGVATLETAGLLVTKVTDDAESTVTYVEGTDYTLTYTVEGYPVVTRIADGDIASATATVFIWHKAIDAAYCGAVAADITDGFEQIDTVYPQFGDVPALLVSPGFSSDPVVAVAMVAAAENYGGGWKAYPLTDIPTDDVDAASEVAAWKSSNSYTGVQEVCWPMVKIGADIYHLSTVICGALGQVDAENGGIPYVSGSNYQIPITGAVLDDGTAVWMTDAQANDSLNALGVTTAINLGTRGWVTWGNYTGAYPGSSDPALIWRNYVRMLRWLQNYARLTFLQKVDQPGNKRQIDSIVTSINIYLNGLAGQGALVGKPQVEFLAADNQLTDLLAGKYTIRVHVTPPTAMQAVTFVWSIDVSQLATLFE